MHTTSLRKVGGSIMLAVPPALLDSLQLQAGAAVGIAVKGGRLIIEPRPRPHYTLDELIAKCNPKARRNRNDHQWVNAKPAGRELI